MRTMSWLRALLPVALLAMPGCASIKMVNTTPTDIAPAGKALVTFVRQSVYVCDGSSVDIWDGEHYVGALEPGEILQYEVAPGDHLFLANSRFNWSYARGSLVEGKRYYLKTNMFPGVSTCHAALAAADRSDPRIAQWQTYAAKAAPEAARAAFEANTLPDVEEAIELFKSGGVSRFAEISDAHAL